MANKIKLKRGIEANLPTLDVGEPAFTTDTKKPFIGSDIGNIELATKEQINYLDAEKADVAYVDTKAAAIASGSPKGTFATLVALQADANANTTDGKKYIYLVTADGKWYYWNGTIWTPGGIYQSTGLADKSVTAPTLGDGVIKLKVGSKNLFNKGTAVADYLVYNTDGKIYANTNYYVSDYILIEPSMEYTVTHGGRIAFYDANKTFVSGVDTSGTNPSTFTTPSNAVYLRFNVLKVNGIENEQLEKGSTKTVYENFYFVIDKSDTRTPVFVSPDENFGSANHSIFNQAYIKDGLVICNDTNHPDVNEYTAKYIGVDLGYRIRTAEIRFGFTGATGNCSIMMITSKLGCRFTTDIVQGSCHFGITPTEAIIEYFIAGVATRKHTHTFATPLQPNIEYSFKWQRIGDDATGWLTVTYPDGEQELLTDAEWVTYSGQYIIFEHFYPNASARRGYYTSWKATGDNDLGSKNYLRHDFSRQFDGLLTVSPSGQIYNLFSNDVHSNTVLGYI